MIKYFNKLIYCIVLLSSGMSEQYTVNLYFELHEEALSELFKTWPAPQKLYQVLS